MSKFHRQLRTAFSLIVFAMVVCLGLSSAAIAQDARATGPVTGLPMPRFVSVGSAPVNVRVGPGTQYDVAWIFVRPGVPVEIVQEFDTWRKIRDVDGAEGWLHQSLVVGARTALVTPWASEGKTPLLRNERPDAAVRAWLTPGMLVKVSACTGSHCAVTLDHTDADEHTTRYSGYIAQDAIWGAYEGEVFD